MRLERNWSTPGILLVTTFFTGLLFTVLVLLTLAGITILGVTQLHVFSQKSGVSISELITVGIAAATRQPQQTAGAKTFLILGLDQLDTRGDAPVLSDTIMLVRVNLQNGHLKALSLPRDLWLPEYQTRVNALYWYGTQQDPTQPTRLPTQAIAELTELKIDHTLVITLDQLAEIVEIIGGVEVNVAEGFTDPTFPRRDVDVTVERDPAVLYKTVSFEAGPQLLNGERVLEYVRSRKSLGTEGTDDARTLRQQQVISALLAKLTNPATLTNPSQVASLLRYYQHHFASQLSLSELAATARVLYPYSDQLRFAGQTLSIFPSDPRGVLFHPPQSQYNGQWVYIYRDLQELRYEVQTKLATTPATQ